MYKAFIAFSLLLGLTGCAFWGQSGDARFQGTAIKLRSTAEICHHVQQLRKDGEPEEIEQSMAELRTRGFADLAAEEVIDAPGKGLKDSEVLCLWGAPAKIVKELTDDGDTREIWTYEKRTGLFSHASQELVFEQGRLERVGIPKE